MVIAVCEDQQVYIDGMVNAIISWKESHGYEDVFFKVYLSADELWDDWENGRVFDAMFLDIGFKYMSGFTLAQKIRETDVNIPLIFVTNNDDYLQKGYEVLAYRYLLKPIRMDEMYICLDHCYRYARTMMYDSFVVSKQGYTIRMPYRDVLYIVAGIHSVTIFTRSGKEYHIPLRGTFEKYAQLFPADYFIRCHRGYIVNIMYASKYTQKEITLNGEITIPIGRSYSSDTIYRLHKFFYKEMHT